MRKIYRYNRPMGYVKLPLVSPGNVRAFAQFDSGNPMTGECPTFATSDKFWQMVMEENYVSRGVVSLIQTIPEEGDEVTVGEAFSDVESVKAVSDVYSPVSGIVCEINEELLDAPEKINEEPYEAWFVKVKDITEKEELLSAEEYEAFVESEQE